MTRDRRSAAGWIEGRIAAIQALRAFAVSWVVLGHAFPAVLPGGFAGVDVFFAISGFLITSHLVGQLESDRFTFVAFYLRRARRLLPAALLVLAVTAAGIVLLIPPAWKASALESVGAAAAYVVNWRLAAESVSYFSDNGTSSPVQQFWSLAVEEQFYLVWPVLIVLAWRASPDRRRKKAVLAALLSTIVLLSLASAIVAITRDRASAYFMTHCRAWEFTMGGLAGLVGSPLVERLSRSARAGVFALAWAILVTSGWWLGPQSGGPGPAIFPVVAATCALLILGDRHSLAMAGRLMARRPVQWLGDISYSLYLWHWPLLVLAPFVLGVERLSPLSVGPLLLLMLVLSDLTRRQIENRFRVGPSGPKDARPAIRLAAYLTLSALLAGSAFWLAAEQRGRVEQVADRLFDLSQQPGRCFGARATEPGSNCPQSHRLADPEFAVQNWATQRVAVPNGKLCQNDPGDDRLAPCEWGAADAVARRRIALLGDSHAAMWSTAIMPFAEEDGLRVRPYLASSCAATEDPRSFVTYLSPERREACLSWREAAAAAIVADPAIDTVVVSGNAFEQHIWTGTEWAEDSGQGFADLWSRFLAAGKHVVVIDDVPMLRSKLPDCLARPHPANDPCSRPAAEVPTSTPLSRAVALMPPGSVTFLRVRDVFCDHERCHAIIGGIPAYLDADHISAPMARSLASRIRAALSP